jgi:hypothetical protein
MSHVKSFGTAILLIAFSRSASATQAQPVPIPEDQSTAPQLNFSGVGIGTLTYERADGNSVPQGGLDFSDSALQFGAAQRLYGDGIGSLGLGGVTIDDSNHGTGVGLFMHQAFVDYQTQSFEVLLGRSDNPTAHLVDFPTLRGDDLITLTNPLNPFSSGANEEEHRYANVASVTLNQGLKYFESFHVQHLIDSAGVGSETGINSFGSSLEVMTNVGEEVFARVPVWGVGFEHIRIDAQSPGGIHQFFAGGVLNLNESVTHRFDFRLQDLVSFGSDLQSFAGVTDSFQADSNTVTAAIRYLNDPFGMPGYQIALTAGFKRYFKVANAQSAGWALTGVKRLGQGFDLVAQVQGQWRQSELARVQSAGAAYESKAEIGFIFSFDALVNEHLSPRRSILNQQHQYIPN